MKYSIEIVKRTRILELHSPAGLECRHSINLGHNPDLEKANEGDGATPVGDYFVCAKNPRSKFFLSLCISYPNAQDAQRGLARGLIDGQQFAQILRASELETTPPQHTRLGGEIYIHGQRAGAGMQRPAQDWTQGCIALENQAMRDLFERVVVGTPVRIRP